MIYSFFTPLDKVETCAAIKTAIAAIGGTIKEISPFTFSGKWRAKQQSTVFPQKYTFYVDEGTVRAIWGAETPIAFLNTGFVPRGPQAVWNCLIESLLHLYPQYDFGLVPGNVELVAIEFLGDAAEEVLIAKTTHTPSLAGAIVGGELFGPVGAIIGSSYGTSRTTITSKVKYADCVLARGRFSNGLLAQGRISKKSRVYREILEKMDQLPASITKKPAYKVASNLDINKLSLEEKNALKEAKSYLNCKYLDYSRAELIAQLEYEGYSVASATKAVDSLSVDWNIQAASAAASYMSSPHMSFSARELYEQLVYDGYTTEQAIYGVKSAGYTTFEVTT